MTGSFEFRTDLLFWIIPVIYSPKTDYPETMSQKLPHLCYSLLINLRQERKEFGRPG